MATAQLSPGTRRQPPLTATGPFPKYAMNQVIRPSFALPLACSLALCTAVSLALGSSPLAVQTGAEAGLSTKKKEGLFLESALRALDAGDIEQARQEARKGLEISPENDRFLLLFAHCNFLIGGAENTLLAVETFQRIKSTDDFRVQSGWGAAVERMGMFSEEEAEATDDAARAAELRVQAVTHWEDAHGRFQLSTKARSGEPEAIGGLMRTSALLGRSMESIKHARVLIQVINEHKNALSKQLSEPGISADAEQRLYEALVSKTESEVKTRFHIAEMLRKEGLLSGALEELKRISPR